MFNDETLALSLSNAAMAVADGIETREQWLNAFADAARPIFAYLGSPIPTNTRISVGFPSGGYRSNSVGECWSNIASKDGHFEIFIKPTTESAARVADICSHELCHAALGIAEGHGKNFGKLARGIGLTGKLTATVAGENWFKWAAPVMEMLGPMPYAALRDMSPPRGKRPTFLKKAFCPDCGFIARVTMAHVKPYSHLVCCNPQCDGHLTVVV